MTSPSRTLVDLGAVVGEATLELALEDALRRRLTTIARLDWRLEELCAKGRGGCGRLRRLLEARRSERVTESGLETKLARLLRKGRLPAPTRQYEIFDRKRLVARGDFAYPGAKLIVEAHSYKHHSGRASWYRDIERDRRLGRLGWQVMYVTDEDLRRRPEKVIAEIRDALRDRAHRAPP